MQAVKRFAVGGGLVAGICNGFQILTEAGLLPGALMRNAGLKYICKPVHLRTETTNSPFTNQLTKGEVVQMPIGHMEGNYFCTPEELHRLESEDRIAFRYATPAGEITAEANPNGSLSNIAGVLSEKRNVLGMMPHPDRSSELLLGSADGVKVFSSMIAALVAK
jgi:phosphoribosylformylglycinamidine synthase